MTSGGGGGGWILNERTIDCQVKQKSARSEFIRFRSNVNHPRLASYLFDLFGQTATDLMNLPCQDILFFSHHRRINRLGVSSINKNKLKLFLFAVASGGNLIIFCTAIRPMSDGPTLSFFSALCCTMQCRIIYN